ncbi:hypothetical protein EVG20_g11382 [Dentipellis fragilis]|uniref:Tc1-like transposase DDE domain-containing protein n=1 Tax=Dentipellis fragilis TaxID=205917 RepID=A0A4Y9XMV5_9AGAM|nr:hypothetical protein EVG20_g11382 [Dentipellis fragilis]
MPSTSDRLSASEHAMTRAAEHAMPTATSSSHSCTGCEPHSSMAAVPAVDEPFECGFTGYLSDISEDAFVDVQDEVSANDWYDTDLVDAPIASEPESPTRVHTTTPPSKRRKLVVPARVQREWKQNITRQIRVNALRDIRRRLNSKKEFDGGPNGLQSYRARAIQACLHMMVEKGMGMIAASQMAAAGNMLAEHWGGRQVRRWTQKWVKERILPESKRGNHAKVFSLFSDPAVRAELGVFMRSEKWSMNPAKLRQFVAKQMPPEEASTFAHQVVSEEIPRGLKKYLEEVLLPRLHLRKPKGRGFSLSTMRRVMLNYGFTYSLHKKAIYYDGHERPDVIDDRQTRFIPEMLSRRERIVRYVVGDVTCEVTDSINFAQTRLVLVAHDESTAQANDGQKWSWILDGEQPIKKKGQGRGIHQSDFICSTHGWLAEASETLEYGKNYDGYWNGERFVNQVRRALRLFFIYRAYIVLTLSTQLKEKFFPAFERLHGPGYVAIVLVDNSQGHSAYSEDALRASRMNLNPGGKQARLRDGWFKSNDGQKVIQPMCFPPDHPKFPNVPKGMKQVLTERGLWISGLLMQCKSKCDPSDTNCCAKRILECQPDFKEQKSLVQETIEQAGHICIFLPKFHCEINFIEYFWGAVKRYLREHCDYTFDTLKDNMPKALASVPMELIRKWEHRAWRFIDAYAGGLDAKAALSQVRNFSSKKYASHRRIPEGVARQMD